MKLENRRQKVAPISHFILRLIRYGLFSALMILVSVGIGTVGYSYFGQLNWLDSFHMACMILTGMGPVVNLTTDGGKLFSSLYALYSGVAFLSIMAVFFTPAIHRLMHILHVELADKEN